MHNHNDGLQALCRHYLKRLRYMAKKHGLSVWLNETIAANKRNECEATQKEVEMLARIVDEERVERKEIPKMLDKSYRQCCDDGVFDKIRRLPRVGIYSKVSAILYKSKRNERTEK